MINLKVLVNYIINIYCMVAMFIKNILDNLKKEKDMEMEYYIIKMNLYYMKEILKMIFLMEKGNIIIVMEIIILEVFTMG